MWTRVKLSTSSALTTPSCHTVYTTGSQQQSRRQTNNWSWFQAGKLPNMLEQSGLRIPPCVSAHLVGTPCNASSHLKPLKNILDYCSLLSVVSFHEKQSRVYLSIIYSQELESNKKTWIKSWIFLFNRAYILKTFWLSLRLTLLRIYAPTLPRYLRQW